LKLLSIKYRRMHLTALRDEKCPSFSHAARHSERSENPKGWAVKNVASIQKNVRSFFLVDMNKHCQKSPLGLQHG